MLVYEKGYCGGLGRTLGRTTVDPQECFKLAKRAGASAFSMGRRYRKGRCSVELLEFTSDDYKQWLVRAPLSPPTRACPLTDPDTRVAWLPTLPSSVTASLYLSVSVNPLSLFSHSLSDVDTHPPTRRSTQSARRAGPAGSTRAGTTTGMRSNQTVTNL
eukprot:scaffold135138_cov69-Phaeocystis_antarctica.AAC.1